MSNYNRKYPKVTGSWTYGHIVVPEKLIYIGSSDEPECWMRWKPSGYEGTELQPYIEKHGWDNIKHIVFKDGLTPKQAKQLEDLLITQAKIDGWCINKMGSGWEWKDNRKEYDKQYRQEHKEEIKEYHKQYYQDNKNELEIKGKAYREAHKDHKREYDKVYRDLNKGKLQKRREEHKEERKEYNKQYHKQYGSTIEGKIYNRVNAFNYLHPDCKIETPLEAKQKYLETGYIPSYIKNNDLI